MSGREAPCVKLECPECDSQNIVRILWSMPAYDEKLECDLEEECIVLMDIASLRQILIGIAMTADVSSE